LNELLQVAKIDFIARAPEGHEVEELTRKQMIKALQHKKSISDISDSKDSGPELTGNKAIPRKLLKKFKIKDESIIIKAIDTIAPGHSIGFNKKVQKTFDMPVGEIFEKIRDYKDTLYLIFDGILTNRLLSISINMKIKFIACRNKEEKLRIPEQISVYLI
ncbi:MAG: hypothetical protein ACTSQD_06110, partial [Promethearchaeota archaeon]